MSVKRIEKDGQVSFEVRVGVRSKNFPRIKVELQDSSAKTQNEAEKLERRLMQEANRKMLMREQQGVLWGRLVDDWEMALREGKGSDRHVEVSTAQDYIQNLRIYTEFWMKRPAHEISRMDFKMVLDEMSLEGRSNSRKRAIGNTVNGIWRWATDNGFIRESQLSPARGFRINREEEKKPEILTLTEIRKLLEAAKSTNHEWYPIWAMALHTGMRSGELLALEWTDIDWENKRVMVSKTYNRRFRITKCTKGGYWREVPINEELEGLIKTLKLAAGNRKFVLPRFNDWERGEAARILRMFCQGIGITSVKFHALRACFATQLLKDGVAPIIVMKVGGWKDLKTMQRYIRYAGIEIEGATVNLKILPPDEAMGRVVELFKS